MNVTNAAYLESLQNPADDWHVAVLGTGYVYDPADTMFSDLTDILDDVALTGVVNPGGVFDADDVTIAEGVITAQINSLWIYNNTSGRLFRFNDTGLNFGNTPTGQVVIQWPSVNGVNIFPLGGLP